MEWGSPDGAVHARHAEPPLEALAEGPVWVVEQVLGRRYAAGDSARFENGSLVVHDGGATSRVAAELIVGYETVLVPSVRGDGLWSEYAPGTQVAVVWIQTGDFD